MPLNVNNKFIIIMLLLLLLLFCLSFGFNLVSYFAINLLLFNF
jgi:hypothetical protein